MTHSWKFGTQGLILLTISVLIGTDIKARTDPSQDSTLLNPKKAPTILELKTEKEQIRNVSSKTIVRVTLGCVTPTTTKPTIIDIVLAEKNTNLAPGQTMTDIARLVDFSDESMSEVCASRQSKLAVVDVLFSDGKRWTILKTQWKVLLLPVPVP